jgi:hypothetical protein
MFHHKIGLGLLTGALIVLGALQAFAASAPVESAERSVAYLARVMDAFHNRFPVYDDVS